MIKIAQEGSLSPEHLLALEPDPVGPIADRMNLAIESPTGVARTMSPATSNFLHAPKGGGIHGGGAGLCLGCHQAHLLPFPWTFAVPLSRHHGADHRSVRLGNHLRRTLRWQRPERLSIASLQLRPRPLSVFQGGRADGTGSQLKAVMLPDTFCRADKGMFAAKVRQHTIQPARTPTGRYSQPLRQKTQVALGVGAPNPLPHLHQSKHTPPLQCFFLRLRTCGS